MQGVTLLIAIVASLGILVVKPIKSLMIYIGVLIWYPTYLTVKVGTIDFSVSRIMIFVILIKILLSPGLFAKFRLFTIDKIVMVFAALSLLAGLTRAPADAMLEYWGGNILFDAMLPYFMFRIIVADREAYIALLKSVMLVTIPLGLMAIYQSITGNNPFGFLQAYNAFRQDSVGYSPRARSGFYRANLTFGHSIVAGLYFAMVCGWSVGIAGYVRQGRGLFYSGIAILGLGIIASMSSGPLLALVVLVPVLVLYKYRKYWKMFVASVIGGIVLIEIVSNTAWYEALSRLTFSTHTATYRVLLIKKALGGGMSEHWLTGYGLADPGWDLIGKGFTDVTNHYIRVLVNYGLLGLVPFCSVLVCAFRRLRAAFLQGTNDADRWLVWSVMSTMVGVLIALLSVSLASQMVTAFFIMLAFCANMPLFVGSRVASANAFCHRYETPVDYALPARSAYSLKQEPGGLHGHTESL